MKLLLSLLASTLPLAATCTSGFCSLTEPTTAATVAIPNTSPYSTLDHQDDRGEFRIHGTGLTGAGVQFFAIGTLQVAIIAGSLWVEDFYDTVTNNGTFVALPSGSGDYLGRVTRDITNATLRLEACPIPTGSCAVSTTPITAVAAHSASSFPNTGIAIGGTTTAGSLAFLRWCTGTVASGTKISLDAGGCSNLGDWELNNSGADASGNGLDLSLTSPGYSDTPTYAPFCSAGNPVSFRIGDTAALDGSGSFSLTEGSAAVSYSWSQTTSQLITLSSTTSAQPTFSTALLTFGDVRYSLSCTNTGGTSTSSVFHGAVFASPQHVVALTNLVSAKVVGDLIQYGYNPWPWFDDRNKAWADNLGGLQGDANHADIWNTPLMGSGTCHGTNSSATFTCTGSTFQTTFCNGTSTWDGSTLLVIWDPNALAVGGTGRRPYGITACTSQTSVTLDHAYHGTTATNLSYALWNTEFAWINGSENINYYDNVLAFYALYYRTGISTYRDYARTLADRWFTMPAFNQGLADCNVDTCIQPRLVGFTGLVLRALDGRPDMWPGLRAWTDITAPGNTTWYNDIREQAYLLSVQAICGIADPDPTHKATCQGRVANSIATVWLPHQQSDGSWTDDLTGNSFYVGESFAPLSNLPGTVTPTTGSNILVGSGTGWTSALITSGSCQAPPTGTSRCDIVLSPDNTDPFASHPNDNTGLDCATFQAISVIDGTHLQLDRNYDGCLGGTGGRGYQVGFLLGKGTQPFMMGVVGGAMKYAFNALDGYDPTNAARARQMAIDAVHWLINTGTIETYMGTDYDGLFYGRTFANCEPAAVALTDVNCSQSLTGDSDDVQAIRFLNMEIMRGISSAYQLSQDSAIKTYGDFLYGRTFGGFGGLNADSNYLGTYLENNAFDFTTDKAKDFGFGFGWGLGASWPAEIDTSPPGSVSGGKQVFGAGQISH